MPKYSAHAMWVLGVSEMNNFTVKTADMHLNGDLDRIKVSLLFTNGANDRQIALKYAKRTSAQLTSIPMGELNTFTPRQICVDHNNANNRACGRSIIANWFAPNLGGHTA